MKRAPRQTPILALGLAAVIFLTSLSSVLLIHVPTSIGARGQLPIYSVKRPDRKVAVTIDAAWGIESVPEILDALDQHDVKATFFLVKTWAEAHPDLTEEIHRRGHEIGNHTATHRDMTTLTPEERREELDSTADVIEKITGQRPSLFRPPFGACDAEVEQEAKALGYATIQWSVDSLDWKNISADQIAERVCREIKPGSIILFQSNGQNTAESLDRILTRLQKQGWEIVPVGQMIYPLDSPVGRTGVQERPY